jgi:predicted DNA-binding antitoxin AbrB/MazE fold protein
MSITIEAIYESGVLRPLSPLPEIEEHARVRITVERPSTVDQLSNKVQLDPAIAREIIENPDLSVLES